MKKWEQCFDTRGDDYEVRTFAKYWEFRDAEDHRFYERNNHSRYAKVSVAYGATHLRDVRFYDWTEGISSVASCMQDLGPKDAHLLARAWVNR